MYIKANLSVSPEATFSLKDDRDCVNPFIDQSDASHVKGYSGKRVRCSSVGWNWVGPPARMPVTTRIITFLIGDSCKLLFATVSGRGPHPMYGVCNLSAFPSFGYIYITAITKVDKRSSAKQISNLDFTS